MLAAKWQAVYVFPFAGDLPTLPTGRRLISSTGTIRNASCLEIVFGEVRNSELNGLDAPLIRYLMHGTTHLLKYAH